ncbi:MAG: DUF296 domain-containing protein [archaeon]
MSIEKVKVLSVTFEDGEEILSNLKKALAESSVEKCRITTVEGKISDFDINVFVAGEFNERHVGEEYRLASVHGVFEEKGNLGYNGSLTVSLAGEGHKVVGGDLLKGKAAGEVTIKAEVIKFK